MKRFILVSLFLSLFLLSGCTDYEEKYNELYDQYIDLESKYDSIYSWYYDDKENIGPALDHIFDEMYKIEDDFIVLYDYFFEDENNISFDKAYDSFDNIHDVIISLFYR